MKINKGRLKKGMKIKLPVDGICEVVRVSDFAAWCKPLTKKQYRFKIYKNSPEEKEITINKTGKEFSISATSEVEIIE